MPDFFLEPGQLGGQPANLGIQLVDLSFVFSRSDLGRFVVLAEQTG